jgi:lipoprotein NlpD
VTLSSPINVQKPGWKWPTEGRVISAFAPADASRAGVDIGGNAGQPVIAAADGEVVYSGSGLRGYGELIIIKHSPDVLSAYGHNAKRLVKEGDKVKAGQKIAEMGTDPSHREMLHFEIRRNGKPIDPVAFLQ